MKKRERGTTSWISKGTFVVFGLLNGLVATAPFAGTLPYTPHFGTVRVSADLPDGFKVISVASTATTAALNFPLPGKIVKWEFFFKFTTECENDHFASVTSPGGRKMVVMDRGLHRCSGKAVSFDGGSSDEAKFFVGSRAKGKWKLTMQDLDQNDFSGTLEEAWINFTISNKGTITEHKVSFGGLPMLIAGNDK